MNRKTQQMVIALVTFLAVAVIVALVQSLERVRTPPSGPNGSPSAQGPVDASEHLAFGNPSGATADADNKDNFLMRKPFFALSYNNAKGIPNWVSWRLRREDLGSAKREEFYPDQELPKSFKHVMPRDYTGSGFDRGHMCPHSDRASTPEASLATFVMTNILPQSPSCNQKAWADFEDYCRELVIKKHHMLYIVSGAQGQGGTGTKGAAETIGKDKVAVPAKCWKVVIVLSADAGDDVVSSVNARTRLIAVVMPNDETVTHGWAKYRKSVKEVEELTGYRFFDRVPADIINPLKEVVDKEHIPASRRHKSED